MRIGRGSCWSFRQHKDLPMTLRRPTQQRLPACLRHHYTLWLPLWFLPFSLPFLFSSLFPYFFSYSSSAFVFIISCASYSHVLYFSVCIPSPLSVAFASLRGHSVFVCCSLGLLFHPLASSLYYICFALSLTHCLSALPLRFSFGAWKASRLHMQVLARK